MVHAAISRSLVRARYAALVGLWAAATILALVDAAGDPFDPTLEGTARYGHNSEGILLKVLPMMAIELALALALLRPGSYDRAWPRAAAAFVVFAAWGLTSLVLTMHAGGVVVVHALWVVALALACLVALVWSLVARRN